MFTTTRPAQRLATAVSALALLSLIVLALVLGMQALTSTAVDIQHAAADFDLRLLVSSLR
jgi:hypothetical protein